MRKYHGNGQNVRTCALVCRELGLSLQDLETPCLYSQVTGPAFEYKLLPIS